MNAQPLGVSAPVAFPFLNFKVRAFADEFGEPWFNANDVCGVLGYRNPRTALANHCREKGVAKRDTPSGCGVLKQDTTSKARESQEMTYINEGNLYRLIVKSRKPEAEAFERKVMEEILPAIRKTGRYAPPVESPVFHVTADELDQLVSHRMQASAIGRVILRGRTRRELDAGWEEYNALLSEAGKLERSMAHFADLAQTIINQMVVAGDIAGQLATLRRRAMERRDAVPQKCLE